MGPFYLLDVHVQSFALKKIALVTCVLVLTSCNAEPSQRDRNTNTPETQTQPTASQVDGAGDATSQVEQKDQSKDPGFSYLAQKNFGKRFGAALSSESVKDPKVIELAVKHFGSITPENELKFSYTQPQRGVFNFDQARPILEFAKKNGMKVHGHVLIWHEDYQIPDWVKAQKNNPVELERILKEHVKGVITGLTKEYGNLIEGWDVVNEAVSDYFGLRESIWRKIGNGQDDYIKVAFRAAKEANPNIKLYYNDYLAEGTSYKSNQVFDLVRRLKKEGVPIEGVGLQMHRFANYWPHSLKEISTNMERLKNLGVDIHVSELDYLVADSKKSDPKVLAAQAQFYFDIVGMCMKFSACKKVSIWGVTDKYSWIPKAFPGYGTALPFDEDGKDKAAVAKIFEALLSTTTP